MAEAENGAANFTVSWTPPKITGLKYDYNVYDVRIDSYTLQETEFPNNTASESRNIPESDERVEMQVRMFRFLGGINASCVYNPLFRCESLYIPYSHTAWLLFPSSHKGAQASLSQLPQQQLDSQVGISQNQNSLLGNED